MNLNSTAVHTDLLALVEQFEKGIAPSAAFPHVEHVKVAFAYLCVYPKIEALERFANGIKRLAVAKGKPQAYHETITWAYIFLIHERMIATGISDWEQFAAGNADLFDWKNSILSRYYSKATLDSERARQVFVMPDLAPCQ
jgi:hypothetical protein